MNLKRRSYHRCACHILIFLISNLWSGLHQMKNVSMAIASQQTYGELHPGYYIEVQRQVTVQRGLCVYIPCQFIVPETENLTTNAVGMWINTSNITVASNRERNSQISNNGPLFLVGDVQNGNCSLYIEDLSNSDRYRFRVEDQIRFSYLKTQPYVKVTDLTDKPEISPIRSWVYGEEVTLNCTAPGTCMNKILNPKITWEGNIRNASVENQITYHENDTRTHFSTITFTARKEHNNSTLSCVVRLKEGLTTEQRITIRVEYPPSVPKIKCSIKSKDQSNCSVNVGNTVYFLEGSQLSLTCSADSVPESSLEWKSSNNKQSYFSIDKLIFANLSLRDEGFYSCQATNRHGSSNTSFTIKVMYPPRLPEIKCSIITKELNILSVNNCTMDTNNTIDILEGSQLSLTCSADSVPESSLVWKFSNETKTFSSTHKLSFADVSLSDEGFYTCQATNAHGTRNTSVAIRVICQTKPFPAAAIYGGCLAAVLLVIGGVLIIIMFYKKRKTMQNKENSSQNQVSLADPIYGNSEMFSNGPHDVGPGPLKDHQQHPEEESLLNDQEVQYISLDFSKLKPKVSSKEEEDDAEEVEYAVVKRTD